VGMLPMASVAKFLLASDICNLSAASRHFREECSPNGQLLMVHLTTPKRELSFPCAEFLLSRVCLSMVESIVIDAKRPGGKALMKALASKGSLMTSLTSLRVSAAAETGEFLRSLYSFTASLRPNQLTAIHLSGLRSVANVATVIANQTESLEKFKVDYFVNGHERDISPDFLPVMPRLKALVFDVADVVDLPIELIMNRLQAVKDKAAMEAIYLPHMQIYGDSGRVLELIALLKEFSNVRQLVVRFRHLPLSVREIVTLRETFHSLPAVCISDHFIVMLDSWATWWPQQTAIWDRPEKITGLSVFREQIDFESLGTTANREWLKLSAAQKTLWSKRIAPKVLSLYLQQHGDCEPRMSSASVRAASV